MRSKNYIFKPNGDKLDFIGDFESLYKNEVDPWGQSGKDGEISYYHAHSRSRLVNKLKEINPDSLLEVGCGLGYTTKIIQQSLPDCHVVGMDISESAIAKATKMFSSLSFIVGDIRDMSPHVHYKYDVVILNQLLWYVLESLAQTFKNCFSMLRPSGQVIISQAFLQTPQKYGKDICDGFDGLGKYLTKNKFNIEYSNLDRSGHFIHDDGLLILNDL
tara:strand:+ start:1153 stop:1803 length:651 start_codon:yes stop_codon:yes gene_type:complete